MKNITVFFFFLLFHIATSANSAELITQIAPDNCIALYDPVCGTDDKTYGNACEAAVAGVGVAYEGECIPTGGTEICTTQYDPVCGTDGNTYGNACEAEKAGVSIAHKGECAINTSCNSNADCGDPTQYCNKPTGSCSSPGACTTKPQLCTREYVPVCGCDGNTYGNACTAAAAGVSVAYNGACKDAPSSCISNKDCKGNEYCAKAAGNCGGVGSCKEQSRPGSTYCLAIYDPVCGCDNKTYGNSCEATRAGANIAHKGACGSLLLK